LEDNALALQFIVNDRRSRGQNTAVAFMDLAKAYDSVPRAQLWTAMVSSMGLSKGLVEQIKMLYMEMEARVRCK
jgi:hypothetical protein